MRRTLTLLACLFAAGIAPAEEIATVAYVEGYPTLVRDGKPIYEEIDFGFRVESFDSFRTDSRSSLELAFDAQTGIEATVTVEPDTQFTVEVEQLRSRSTGSVDLIAGSVSVVARSLAEGARFEIRSATASMGVRGTTFSVTGAPGGELLVATEEGLVEVTSDEGRTLFASPGEAVEIDDESALFRTVRYDRDDLQTFRSEWRARRAALFAERAPEILRFHGRRYLEARDRFMDAYAELMTHRGVIDEWMDESSRGVRPRIGDLRDRRELGASVVRVRAAMRQLEPTIARLEQMAPFVRELAPDVELRPGVTAADLYAMVRNDRRAMEERVATVRYVLKLAAQRLADE